MIVVLILMVGARAMFWLFFALLALALMCLSGVWALIGGLVSLASPSAAKSWRHGAQGLWRATMAVGAMTDRHRRWLLPNPPAR
jgi:uncharacterized membrane protein HdeD (DUF308 family)